MALASPLENISKGENSIYIPTAAGAVLIGHTLCACQIRRDDQFLESATISACADMGGEMGSSPTLLKPLKATFLNS
jgi:hypothetical protein